MLQNVTHEDSNMNIFQVGNIVTFRLREPDNKLRIYEVTEASDGNRFGGMRLDYFPEDLASLEISGAYDPIVPGWELVTDPDLIERQRKTLW